MVPNLRNSKWEPAHLLEKRLENITMLSRKCGGETLFEKMECLRFAQGARLIDTITSPMGHSWKSRCDDVAAGRKVIRQDILSFPEVIKDYENRSSAQQ